MIGRVSFYALGADLLPALEEIEHAESLKYVRFGHSATEDVPVFVRARDLPGLGLATSESAVGCEKFVVTVAPLSIVPRPILVGGVERRFAFDQLVNPDTVTLRPGGAWGDDVVLSGEVSTVSDSKVAQRLMRRFRTQLRKRFVRVRAFLVGPGAEAMLDAGKRLTIGVRSPPEYDLAREPPRDVP